MSAPAAADVRLVPGWSVDRARLARGGYGVLLAATIAVSAGWLAVGAVVAVARYWPGALAAVAESAAGGSAWARGVLVAAPRSEPLGQASLDYALSGLNLVLAAVLLAGGRSWPLRLLVIAMVGSAGAFNLQAHAVAVAVEIATGLSLGRVHQVVLHGVACAAYILALLLFPTAPRSRRPRAGPARHVLAVVTACTLLVVGLGTALLPHTQSCILFFGFLVPLAGLAALSPRVRHGATAQERTQARLLLSALTAAFVAIAVLAVVTPVLAWLGQPGLTVHDPTVAGGHPEEPTALLFWASRLASVAIAAAVLVATRRTRLWAAEQLFSRGLAATLMVALAGGGYIVVRAALGGAPALAAAALAAVPVALVFLPLYLRLEGLVDRLLYGARPTPYRALAGVAALSGAADAPDLARTAEAVARGLGASACRLTVHRPGLRDRSYHWSDGTAADDLVAVPVRHCGELVGEVAVDPGAVAGLDAQRRHLLDSIADGLGVVLQASRSGIELERQLRAAVAHAEEIAVVRRRAVAEMDAERRRIERDLHDGAQHHLVSLRLSLGLVEYKVRTGELDGARERLDKLSAQIRAAETVLAETATGMSSLNLADRGLVAALSAALSGSHPPVTIDAGGIPPGERFPPDVAAAAYFCCLEAVNNARKHAAGVPVAVTVAHEPGALRVAVRDEGPGFAAGAPTGEGAGRGLRNLAARIGAVGGTMTVRSAPGAGTTVAWSLPLPTRPPAVERGGCGLLDEVRDLVRAARAAYRGTAGAAALDELAARLGDAAPQGDVGAARSALCGLEDLLRSAPPAGDAHERLRYRLERVRSGAHELTELDVVDRLPHMRPPLPAEQRRAAERLLGARGDGARARLGLPADAGDEEVRRAAEEELARWQRLALHPASAGPLRDVAQAVVHTVERVLTRG